MPWVGTPPFLQSARREEAGSPPTPCPQAKSSSGEGRPSCRPEMQELERPGPPWEATGDVLGTGRRACQPLLAPVDHADLGAFCQVTLTESPARLRGRVGCPNSQSLRLGEEGTPPWGTCRPRSCGTLCPALLPPLSRGCCPAPVHRAGAAGADGSRSKWNSTRVEPGGSSDAPSRAVNTSMAGGGRQPPAASGQRGAGWQVVPGSSVKRSLQVTSEARGRPPVPQVLL